LEGGEFYMYLKDYVKYFTYTYVCKYNDDDIHSYAFKHKPVSAMSFFEFELEEGNFNFGEWGIDVLVN